MYYLHMSMADIEQCDSTELNYIHGWLYNKKKEEAEAMKPKKGLKDGR